MKLHLSKDLKASVEAQVERGYADVSWEYGWFHGPWSTGAFTFRPHSSLLRWEARWGLCSGHNLHEQREGQQQNAPQAAVVNPTFFCWMPYKEISLIMEIFLALILQLWEAKTSPNLIVWLKSGVQKWQLLEFGISPQVEDTGQSAFGLGSFPAPPAAWLTSSICCLLLLFLWHVFCSARSPSTDWKAGCSPLRPV